MLIVEFAFALAASLLCAALLLPVAVRVRGVHHSEVSPSRIFFLLLILFFATWAGGIWLAPVGPRVWGESWLGFLVIALLVGLLMAALARPLAMRASASAGLGSGEQLPVFNVFTLLLILLLLLAIVAGYARVRS